MYVCICNQVTDRDIREAVNSEGACCMRDLQQRMGVASCCGCCAPCARDVLAAALRERDPVEPRRLPVPVPQAS